MTTRYKTHKQKDKYNDGYFKPKITNPDSKERQLAKKEISQELKDQHINKDFIIRDEARRDREESEAWACYEMELSDPSYRCTCFNN